MASIGIGAYRASIGIEEYKATIEVGEYKATAQDNAKHSIRLELVEV